MNLLYSAILVLGVFNFDNICTFQGNFSYLENNNRYRREDAGKYCEIPINPLHGEYMIVGDDSGSYKSGDFAQEANVLLLRCDRTFKLAPLASNISYCFNGLWIPTPSRTCARTCKTLTPSKTTQIQCRFNNIPLENCDDPVEGTVAFFSCGAYYEEPSIELNPYRVCTDGEWDGTPRCFPICGEKRPEGDTNIVNGTNAVKGNYPWHVGIYNSTKSYLCGGSIISQRIVISAAHCLSDQDDGKSYPTENYLIAAGKYYQKYADVRDPYPQYPIIQHIYIPETYRGYASQQDSDIAVIVLKNNLILSVNVQPVCVDWSNNLERQQLIPNNTGTVVGWGYTREIYDLSDELKELSIPFIPFNECFNAVPKSFKKFLHQDKICGGYLKYGTSVCKGDSGGGLVFPSQFYGRERYYLRGIVSTSSANVAGLCDSNQYGLFTLLSKHKEFVNNLYINNKPIETRQVEPQLATTNLKSHNGCSIPPNPTHGKYIISSNNENKVKNTGQYAVANSNLTVFCDEHYQVYPSDFKFSTCTGEMWNLQPAKCYGPVTTTTIASPLIGVKCTVKSSGKNGECRLIRDCLTAPQEISQDLTCGFRGHLPIICCEERSNGTSITATAILSSTLPLVAGEKSKQKCVEYGKYVMSGSTRTGTVTLECDRLDKGYVENIVSESFATERQFPHMARIRPNSSYVFNCSGSLISDKFVLTTAYCMRDKPKLVRLGYYSDANVEIEDFDIRRTIIHPDYDSLTEHNDIALLELERTVKFSASVRPACLKFNYIENEKTIASTYQLLKNGLNPLYVLPMDKVTHNKCNDLYRKQFGNNTIIDSATELCAKRRYKNTDAYLQSGSALLISNSGEVYCTYKIIGVSSRAQYNLDPSFPIVYTRVSAYIQWIEDIVWP